MECLHISADLQEDILLHNSNMAVTFSCQNVFVLELSLILDFSQYQHNLLLCGFSIMPHVENS